MPVIDSPLLTHKTTSAGLLVQDFNIDSALLLPYSLSNPEELDAPPFNNPFTPTTERTQSSNLDKINASLGVLDQSVNKEPFIVGLYYGASKPNDANSYHRPFVDECIDLENDGIIINDKKYAFRVSCITADAPARAFLKCIKSHNSLHACEKCTQEGTFLDRTTWQYTSNLNLRTDLGFNNEEYEHHQIKKTILTELDIGLVMQVPLDYMHLVCLGVMKKLIGVWIDKGPKKCRLNFLKVYRISERLEKIKKKALPNRVF